MNDPILTQLLRDADDAAPPPPPVPGLARQVRARAAARARQRRMAVAALLPVALVVLAAAEHRFAGRNVGRVVTSTRPVSPDQAPRPDAAPMLAESKRLVAQAEWHQSAAASLDALRRRRERMARAREVLDETGADPVMRERERAALSLLDHAERLRRDLKQPDAALETYRRTIELFPDTRWANVARQRIDELKPDARGPVAAPHLS